MSLTNERLIEPNLKQIDLLVREIAACIYPG